MSTRVILMWAAACAAAAICSADDAMSPPRLEKMLTDGDTQWVVQTFRRHPDDVLAFFDRYLEGGLKIIEEGGSEDDGLASFRKGLEFAKLANEAFGEVIFANYAANFGSWSPQERTRFREGQKAVSAARKAKDDPTAALAHYRRALKLAAPLGDSWGEAMAHMGIAKTQLALGNYEECKAASLKAAELNGRLRLRVTHVRARQLCARAHARLGSPAAGRGHLRIAWESLTDDDDIELRRSILDDYCTALEAASNHELAEQLRAEFEKETQSE
jgi:tetratricopeptide (TPR) repeat protein